ncbi:hypothetical protein ACFWI9_11880, partial [Streptomyces sp. NPDC127084]
MNVPHVHRSARPMLPAALACVLVGASFTANSVLADYPYAGGQAIRYGLACLLLLPLLIRSGATPLRSLAPRQWGPRAPEPPGGGGGGEPPPGAPAGPAGRPAHRR